MSGCNMYSITHSCEKVKISQQKNVRSESGLSNFFVGDLTIGQECDIIDMLYAVYIFFLLI